MVRRCHEQVKLKYILKTFLCANKGKKYTSREICDFILENNLSSKGSELNRSAISHLIRADKYILSNVHIEKIKGRNYYWIEKE